MEDHVSSREIDDTLHSDAEEDALEIIEEESPSQDRSESSNFASGSLHQPPPA
jgi:hypothetical protein